MFLTASKSTNQSVVHDIFGEDPIVLLSQNKMLSKMPLYKRYMHCICLCVCVCVQGGGEIKKYLPKLIISIHNKDISALLKKNSLLQNFLI